MVWWEEEKGKGSPPPCHPAPSLSTISISSPFLCFPFLFYSFLLEGKGKEERRGRKCKAPFLPNERLPVWAPRRPFAKRGPDVETLLGPIFLPKMLFFDCRMLVFPCKFRTHHLVPKNSPPRSILEKNGIVFSTAYAKFEWKWCSFQWFLYEYYIFICPSVCLTPLVSLTPGFLSSISTVPLAVSVHKGRKTPRDTRLIYLYVWRCIFLRSAGPPGSMSTVPLANSLSFCPTFCPSLLLNPIEVRRKTTGEIWDNWGRRGGGFQKSRLCVYN